MRSTIRKSRRRWRGRAGFTLVEIIVAILVLVVGVLGLATTSAMVSRLIGGAAQQSLAATVAESRFETLRSTRCSLIANGAAQSRGVTETWRVAQVEPLLFQVEVDVTFTTVRGTRQPQPYRSNVRCRP